MDLKDELRKYPLTGRFLVGRARQGMSEEEKRALEEMAGDAIVLDHGTRIISRGQSMNQSTMLVDGFMLRTIDADDRRFVVSFHVPGDFVDLHCYALKRLDHNIDCIGPTKVAFVPHERITRAMGEDPHLGRLMWFSTLLDAAMHREWIVKLEELTVPRRMAHIFSEIWRRMQMVGLGFADGFATPLTQSDLADMCGSSLVHANRAVQELRRLGIADFDRGSVRIADRRALEDYARFDASYLYGDGTLALSRADASPD